VKAGDKIRLQKYIMGHPAYLVDYEVEEFRYCLGIFESPAHRKAGNFTPLCALYESGPDSKSDYISNYGEYVTNQVPSFMNITAIEYDGYNQ
jgi:hypothetical protein